MQKDIVNEILKLSLKLWISFHKIQSWILNSSLRFQFWDESFFQKNDYILNSKPIIKWVWGKRQLLSQFEELFPKEFNNYFEPFLGWWTVFFHLQREKSFLSDINEELINLYEIVKNNPNELIDLLEKQEISKEKFLEIRAWDREKNWKEKYSKEQRAMRFMYLNRTCFNWLYRVNSKWQFNVPFWKYKNPDIVQKENILNASKLLNNTKAEIRCQSFEKVLEKAEKWDFVYFDPPYDVLTESANFTSYNESWFGRDMQEKLRDVCLELDKKWVFVMVSNHNTDFIRNIYKNFRLEVVKAKRNINSKWNWRWEIEEVVILNY